MEVEESEALREAELTIAEVDDPNRSALQQQPQQQPQPQPQRLSGETAALSKEGYESMLAMLRGGKQDFEKWMSQLEEQLTRQEWLVQSILAGQPAPVRRQQSVVQDQQPSARGGLRKSNAPSLKHLGSNVSFSLEVDSPREKESAPGRSRSEGGPDARFSLGGGAPLPARPLDAWVPLPSVVPSEVPGDKAGQQGAARPSSSLVVAEDRSEADSEDGASVHTTQRARSQGGLMAHPVLPVSSPDRVGGMSACTSPHSDDCSHGGNAHSDSAKASNERGSHRQSHRHSRGMWSTASVISNLDSLRSTARQFGSACRKRRTSVRRIGSAMSLADLDQAQEATVWCLKKMVDHPIFSAVCLAAILANTLFLGVHTDWSVQRFLGTPWRQNASPTFHTFELMFCCFFTGELVLRVCSGPVDFLRGADWKWNSFDLLLVLTCIAEVLMQLPSMSYIRLLRLVRMARILRIIRVMRFFRSLRLMVYSIIHSLFSLLWVFMILLFAIYMFSIGIMYALWLMGDVDTDDETKLFLVYNFGTVVSSMHSLFMAISGGRDWHELYYPLYHNSAICAFMFIFYIFFVVFGVLNTVTGAFVDSMRLVSMQDNDVVIEESMNETAKFRRDVKQIFEEADADESGTLSWEEFESHLQDERVEAYFRSLELDVSQARALFLLLDMEETDEVPIEKFVEGCMRMRGDAKSIDVNMLLYENEKMLLKVTSFTEYAEDKFERIEKALGIYGRAARPGEKEWLEDRRRSLAASLHPDLIAGPSSLKSGCPGFHPSLLEGAAGAGEANFASRRQSQHRKSAASSSRRSEKSEPQAWDGPPTTRIDNAVNLLSCL